MKTFRRLVNLALAIAIIGTVPMFAAAVGPDVWHNFRTQKGVDLGAGVDFAYNHSSFGSVDFDPGVPAWIFTSPAQGSVLTLLDRGELGDIYRDFASAAIPEPATFALVGAALLAIGIRRKNRPKRH